MLQSPIVIPNIHHPDIVHAETLPGSLFRGILIHGSTVPVTYLAIKGEPTVLPPLSMVILIWSGLLLFFIRSAIMKDKLYLLSNGIGFFLQSIMLAFLVFK